MDSDEDRGRDLTGVGGADVSAGTSVSRIGGEATRTEDDDAGLTSVADRAARVAWGKDAAEGPEQPVATNDGTGQSEKPPQ